jgi:hypothetical protein
MHFPQPFNNLSQAYHFFVLLKEHRHQEGLKGQCVRGIGGSGDVFLCGSKEIVKNELIAAA